MPRGSVQGGWSALLHATSNRRADAVRLLLQHGADVHTTDVSCATDHCGYLRSRPRGSLCPLAAQNDKWTALHVACLNEAVGCVPLLLAAGCDPLADNDDGETAADIAKRADSNDMLKMLGSA